MKKGKTLLVLLFMLPFLSVTAQVNTKGEKWRKKYVNFSFTNMKMKQDGVSDLKSNYGAAFTVGRTFYLHQKPIASMIRFGVDATWFDLNYANYKIQHITHWDTDEYEYHQGEISMQVGPSITVNPVGKLNIHGYFRFAPTFAGLYDNDSFYGNYASLFVGGGSISYGVVGLGIESRFGDCKYKEFGTDDEDEDSSKLTTKLSGWRVYLSFKF